MCERTILGILLDAEVLHATLDSINISIIVTDEKGIIVFINRWAETITGLKADEVIGKMVDHVVPGTSLLSVLKSGVSEFNRRLRIGNIDVLANRTPIWKDKQIIGAVSVFHEITELNEIAAELEEVTKLKSTLEFVLESIEEGIVVVDKQAMVTMMNSAYCRFLGKTPSEVIGKPVTEVIPNTRLHEVVQDGRAEFNVIQKIHVHNCVVSRIPVVKNGEIICAIGNVVFKDVEDLKRLAKKLSQLQHEIDYYKEELRKTLGGKYTIDDLIGNNEEFQRVKNMGLKTAKGSSSVLISGESGTGKELFAHAIHNASPRCHGPFIKVNCAAIPEGLLESELFGYEEGAFSGARRGGKPGKIELANGGTLFLDEIGDMPLSMQAKLLRVLQEREVERVGGTKAIKLDARVITATNKDLEELCAGGQFRSDLYYRLNIVSLNIPPLRERRDDIPLLCEMLLSKINLKLECFVDTISPECMDKLTAYSWPGNVRELENVLERAVNIMDEGVCILREHLPRAILTPKYNGEEEQMHRSDLVEAKQDIEKKAIMKALAAADGNKSKAALLLCMNRSVFYERLRKYNIG